MVKFTEIKESAKTTFPSAPWSLKGDYKKTATVNGHTYELTKYVRDPNLWERLTCVLSAAWLWLKSCGKDQKKFTSQWDKALRRKQICVRFGTLKTSEPNPNDPPKTDPKKDEIKLTAPDDEIYQAALKALEDKNYKFAKERFLQVAQIGYQPAFDHLRKLAEEKHTDWDPYNKAVCYDPQHKLVKMQFSDVQRKTIKTAIEKGNGVALHQLTLECIGDKKYPEAYLCGCLALNFGHEETLRVIYDQVKNTYQTPYKCNEEQFLNSSQTLKEFLEIQNPTKMDFNKMASVYDTLISQQLFEVLMDKELQESWTTWLVKQAIHYYKEASDRGDGHALKRLIDFQQKGFLTSDEVKAAREQYHLSLKVVEQMARKNNDLSLWGELKDEYRSRVEELDFNKAAAWLKEVAEDPNFEPKMKDLQENNFNYNLIRVCAESAKLGDIRAMIEINKCQELLPNKFLTATQEAFKKVIEPQIDRLLKAADVNDDKEKIKDLREMYQALKNLAEYKKWDNRLTELGAGGSQVYSA